jgi:hypothetical protein
MGQSEILTAKPDQWEEDSYDLSSPTLPENDG